MVILQVPLPTIFSIFQANLFLLVQYLLAVVIKMLANLTIFCLFALNS